ncbi:uncharacterized protein LOC124811556 [Hydra vulgaris]|uniref:uncharacterized protein LOC124811556 n=1 Tax=Hydra vulgaris TaxID=6087 RepID=UPI001F5EE979|nr:uncharacterized protein LOC124811556 [Hydra vulgaris]
MLALDGKTLSENRFSGNIGKLINIATNLPILTCIPQLDFVVDLIHLEKEVVDSLSTDQKYLYRIHNAIASDVFPDDLKEIQIGLHNHSRWLNLANRLLRICCSEHCLKNKDLQNLKLLTEVIMGVYSIMWFDLKTKHSWIQGPHHILKQLALVKKQNKFVKDIVLPHICSSAWNAHSECILQTMLCSSDEGERRFEVQKIRMLETENAGLEEYQ